MTAAARRDRGASYDARGDSPARKIPLPGAAEMDCELRELVSRKTSEEDAKVIAFDLRVPVRTVRGWQRADHLPRPGHLFELARRYPALRDKSLEYIAGALDVDPADPNRLLSEIARLLFAAERGRT